MKEILITSSVLILVLLVLRRLFRNTISRRAQYALWAVVLVRLLVPVSLPAVDFSILTVSEPVQSAVVRRMEERPVYVRPVERASISEYPMAYDLEPGDQIPVEESSGYVVLDGNGVTVTKYAEKTTAGEILVWIWKAGAAAMACFFLLTNLRFWAFLRKNRKPFPTQARACPVYLCEGLPSPCLFGLFRPAVYLTPAAAANPASLRHVLSHEETHARHLDPLWSLLRGVCLSLYWFDPLVWAAAWCSKTDCELACDEGALRRLGDGERLAYGQTLLSLIPVRRGPANPLLSATTMTAGKRQLKERIIRITENRRGAAVALVTAAALVAAVSACAFTGSKVEGPRALTGDELAFFNEEFFNGGDVSTGDLNLHNQFLSSLYEKPEDIDLFELFYCEGSASSAEENMLVYGQTELECMAYRLTTAEMDALLTENMGLTLAQTNKIGLDSFTYLPEQDAYYWAHGDTNYRSRVTFSVGEREGDTLRLYYDDDYIGGGWKCLTLAEQDGGGYHFVSNQPSEKPVIPTPLPKGKPEYTISLKNLEPYQAPAVTVEPHVGDFSDHYEDRLENWDIGGRNVQIYRATDGNIHAAVVAEDGTRNVFLSGLDEDCRMFFYNDLFGHDGFYVAYFGQVGTNEYGTVYDYYYFAGEDDTPILLARCTSWEESLILDLDGDGTNELVSGDQIFFQRDGVVYEADLPDLLAKAWPEIGYWDYSVWDANAKCLTVTGTLEPHSGVGDPRTFWRYFYYDGENLLVYKDTRTYSDHVMEGVAAPTEVVAAAKDYVLSLLEPQGDGTWLRADREGYADLQESYDDWRIESVSGPYVFTVGELTIQGYSFNFECHTTTPERVVLAGGKYLTEDDWVSPGYPGCDWLFFHVNANSGPVYLWHDMINDMSPDSVGFQELVAQRAEELGLNAGAAGYAALDIQNDLNLLMDAHSEIHLVLTPASPAGGGAYTVSTDFGSGRNRQRGFTDPAYYHWSRLDSAPQIPMGDRLILTDPDWYDMLQFWDGSDLVMSRHADAEPVWYRAELVAVDDVFATDIYRYLRDWYDEAEWNARTGDISIPNAGQSRLEAAHAWVGAHEGAMLEVSPGGVYACTYVRSRAEVVEEMPEDWFPEEILDYEHFAFAYTTVFVPENDRALMWMMAGNTVEYEGTDAPAGAFEYSRRGAMYLGDDGQWHCSGIGTG